MNKSDMKYIAEGGHRVIYQTKDRLICKVPKNDRGLLESQNEYRIYNECREDIKQSLCPVVSFDDNRLYCKQAKSLSQMYEDGEIDFEEIERLIHSKWDVVVYLVMNFEIDEVELTLGSNWGMIDGELVIIDYGCLNGYED